MLPTILRLQVCFVCWFPPSHLLSLKFLSFFLDLSASSLVYSNEVWLHPDHTTYQPLPFRDVTQLVIALAFFPYWYSDQVSKVSRALVSQQNLVI
jgi:hypothetical protein